MTEDTIAAISTPAGEGGIGIVRISGAEAFRIGREIFRFAGNAQKQQSHKLYYGQVVDGQGRAVDEALITFMRAPHTYTREDVVEINCHGGILPLAKTLAEVFALGARPALPGEFTQRAFLHGRIDLAQAEAVIQLIRARTDAALALGISQLQGRLSAEVAAVRRTLLSVLAHLEASIDFPEHQDVEELALEELRRGAESALEKTENLLQTADKGRIMREGLRTAIIGRPNVGKSSLLNALLREQRAIVTAVPGTTRDILEESVNLGGVSLTIVDTAGIRDTHDEVEKIGVERSRMALEASDLILYVLDVSREICTEDKQILAKIEDRPCILVFNKADLPADAAFAAAKIKEELPDYPSVLLSALEEEGLAELEKAIVDLVFQGEVASPQSVMVTSTRHKDALRRAGNALHEMLDSLNAGFAVDLLAIDLHTALDALGEITGENVGSDLAAEIFRNFCIGK